MRDGLFACFISAMLVVSLAPRHRAVATPISSAELTVQPPELRVQLAWLGQRESAFGDWESVKPPLREGDELQLTVLLSENACVYVFDDGGQQLFPPPGLPPALHANWPYAIPGTHRSWRLDDAKHDTFFVVAARHPLANPALEMQHLPSSYQTDADLLLPLRDGGRGAATTHTLQSSGVIVDRFVAR